MSFKPHICGKNRINMPTSGCNDCSELAYRIEQLEDWVNESYIDDDLLDSLTPLECYQPPCEEPIVCTTTVCCGKTACESEEITPTEVASE